MKAKFDNKILVIYSSKDSKVVVKFEKEYFEFMQTVLNMEIIKDDSGISSISDIRDIVKRAELFDFIILFITENYLLSTDCSLVSIDLVNHSKIRHKLIPLIFDWGIINKNEEWKKYYDIWEEKINISRTLLVKYESAYIVEKLRLYKNIRNNIDTLFSYLLISKSVRADVMFQNETKALEFMRNIAKIVEVEPKRVDILFSFFKVTFCGIHIREFKEFISSYGETSFAHELVDNERQERKLRKLHKKIK